MLCQGGDRMLYLARQFFIIIFSLSLLSGGSLVAKAASYEMKPSDVHKVMNKMMRYHIDHKSMNAELMDRSIRIYINQFDPERIYLLENEVESYWNLSSNQLTELVVQYHQGNYEVFEQLNDLFAQSIARAQKIRDQIRKDPQGLSCLTSEEKDPRVWETRVFAETDQELHNRWKERYQYFLMMYATKDQMQNLALVEKGLQLHDRKKIKEEKAYLILVNQNHAVSITEKEHEKTVKMLKAFSKSLDTHTAFYSPEEAYRIRVSLEKGFQGIGIIMRETLDGVIVTRLVEGGPAAESRMIQLGDKIIAIDQHAVDENLFCEASDLLKGEEGTQVTLTIQRESEVFNITLPRKKIVMQEDRVSTQSYSVPGGIIGVITLDSFYEGENISSDRDVRRAIVELQRQGPLKGLVLDLRNNLGGFLTQAVKVAGLFVSNGIIAVSKYSDGSMRYYRDLDGFTYYDGPMLVLISKLSASAAEVVAAALQDYGVAVIAGSSSSYGKGSLQHQTITNPDADLFFKVTVGRYYTVSGRSAQITGVCSDIVIPNLLENEPIGEKYAEYPLSADRIDPMYHDTLLDIDPSIRKWFEKFYLPSVAQKNMTWQKALPELESKSQDRVRQDPILQQVISSSEMSYTELSDEEFLRQVDQHQVTEAVNIVKDMIEIQEEKPCSLKAY